MEPLVSVVIPTKNWAKYLDRCLSSIRYQSFGNIEIIVVDDNSRDNSKEIAEKHGCKVINFAGGRCAQRNCGTKQAEGDFLLIIDGDMMLSREVVKKCVETISANPQIEEIIIPEESFGRGFWSRCKRMERSYYIGLDWMEAARFFRRKTFTALGGYNEELVGGDDYDLSQRIEQKFGRRAVGRITDLIYHDERKLSLLHSCRKKFKYGKTIISYKEMDANKDRFGSQSSIIARYKLFFSRPDIIVRSPHVFLGMLFMKTCEFGAGGLGYASGLVKKRHAEHP